MFYFAKSGYADGKSCALPYLTVNCHLASHFLDYLLADAQSETSPSVV